MLFAGNLEQGGESSLVLVHRGTDLLCDLGGDSRQYEQRPRTQCSRTPGPNRSPKCAIKIFGPQDRVRLDSHAG